MCDTRTVALSSALPVNTAFTVTDESAGIVIGTVPTGRPYIVPCAAGRRMSAPVASATVFFL
ncbi:hypothetical protein MLP_33940 [Microlunatus phosphovorus NM-1]|uniref:Uncharacterized protein n=1 Tax=Microlunatus phosphovorus (strain ATCC 700054 / DSM 10555 / JCM 9379 / NBRC 101784 / NCIMB 13414 / VKM Ac-1990 / NM-1) TaxID=1032480 RepID=F5XMF1_MICPN|nr:hypothetical protein MLP_33940 [Microlunatus phosphovorus NM-1]